MKSDLPIRDERYYSVENASYRIGYMILSFGTMALVVIHSILYQQSNWDFFGLVWISSMAATVYQLRHKILPYTSKSFILMMAIIVFGSAAFAAAIVMARTYLFK
jgi:hypothetical protein